MTRKTLGFLVITPVMFFALDKAVSTDGGGKEKPKKSKHTVEAPAVTVTTQAPIAVYTAAQPCTPTVINIGTGTGTAMSREQKLTEVKKLRESILSYNAFPDYYEINTFWCGWEEIPEATRKFLNEVEKEFEDANLEGISIRSFSRCPSGYNVMIIADAENKPTNECFLIWQRGCSDTPMAKCRFDVEAKTIEVMLSETAGYVSLDEFVELYKEAAKS